MLVRLEFGCSSGFQFALNMRVGGLLKILTLLFTLPVAPEWFSLTHVMDKALLE